MANVITLPNVAEELMFVPGALAASAVYEYKDGERSNTQACDDRNIPQWQIRNCRLQVLGVLFDDAVVVVSSPTKPVLDTGELLSVATLVGPISLSIRARAKGGDFADLAVKVIGTSLKTSKRVDKDAQ